MSETSGDRSHPASPVQLGQARRAGDVPRSNELAAAVQNLGGLLVMTLCCGGLASWLVEFTRSFWSPGALKPAPEQLGRIMEQCPGVLLELVSSLAIPLGLLAAIGVASFWLQTGVQFRAERVVPKLSRLGASRWQNLDGTTSLLKFILSVPKLVAGTAFLGLILWRQRHALGELASLPVEEIPNQALGMLLFISFQVAILLFVFSLLDYAVEWFAQRRRWQMSDQQIRDEERMENGDPVVQNHRRQRQWELSQRGR